MKNKGEKGAYGEDHLGLIYLLRVFEWSRRSTQQRPILFWFAEPVASVLPGMPRGFKLPNINEFLERRKASFARLLMLLYVISKVSGNLLSTSPLQTPVDDDYDEIDNIFVRSSLIMFIINTVFCLLLKRKSSLGYKGSAVATRLHRPAA